MNFFAFDLKKVVIGILLIAIPLISINLQKNPKEVPWFLVPFHLISGTVQQGYSTFSSGVRGTTTTYLNVVSVNKQNTELTKDNLELRAKLGELTELKLENERLNSLLNFTKATEMQLVAARIIGNDLLPDHHSITIDRGESHGIKKSMAAITSGGVVGYVIQVQQMTSEILLLTDRYAVIDAMVQRSRARGVVEGKSREASRFNFALRDDDILTGDLVVTSGFDAYFPKGFPIGVVTYVRKNQYEMSQLVELKPMIDPYSIEEIFIVLSAKNEDFTDKIKTEPPMPDVTTSTEEAVVPPIPVLVPTVAPKVDTKPTPLKGNENDAAALERSN